MTARWQAAHAYALGTIILPTVDNGRCYYASVAGTSGATEPTWPGRFPGVLDGTALTWTPYTIIQPQTIRDIQGWDDSTGRYSDTVIGNYLLDSIAELEKTTRRYFVNKPGFTWQVTSYGRPILALPGIRSASAVTWQGAVQTAGIPGQGAGYMLLPDAQQTGVYTSISFRPRRLPDGGPWWLSLGGATTNWFDTAADSPFDPRNYGAGYSFTSTELDTIIVGDWGYEPGSEPGPFVHALEVLGSFAQQRPVSLLADSVITPQGGVLSYSQMPAEIRQFVSDWSAGQMAVPLG